MQNKQDFDQDEDDFSFDDDDDDDLDISPARRESNDFDDDDYFDDDDDADAETDSDGVENHEVDLSVAGFPEITRRFEETPHQFFEDPNYYKTALSNEGEIAQRVHSVLQKYLNAKDPKDRSVFRPQLITAYWEFLRGVARKTPGKLPESKKYLLRFNLLHPHFIKSETKEFFAKLINDNELNQPVYYLDEWFKGVGTGVIQASTTDEVNIARGNSQAKMMQLLEKASGKLVGLKTLIKGKDLERDGLEQRLHGQVNTITEHAPMGGFDNVREGYTEPQKRTIAEIQETLKTLLKSDREMNTYVKEYYQAEADVKTLQGKVDEGAAAMVDIGAIESEFDTVRQTAKMTVGRQGNHFPILTGEYFHCGPNDVGFRENVISMLARIESIDQEAFCRYYRNKLNRIVPYVVLIPTYGDTGVCWEPFNKHNRATSRGRIFIPMYPKNLYIAVLSAVADLRWQVAKEKASYYWMEEGITGNYYQWWTAQKYKGNIKDYFVQDYILWMTKEAEGIQKLDKELRGAFWRYMPFSQEVKEKLRNRSYVYQELYQRDLNRAMSDGY